MSKASKARGLRGGRRGGRRALPAIASSPKSSARFDREIEVRGRGRALHAIEPLPPKSTTRIEREINEALAQPLVTPRTPTRRHKATPAVPVVKPAVTARARKVGLVPRPPTSTSDVRSPTSTSTEVRSPTSTSTEVRSPTSTSTDAYTSGNVTVTGGAGDGATTEVKIYTSPQKTPKGGGKEARRADSEAHGYRSRGSQTRMTKMIGATMAPRTPAPMPAIMRSTSAPKPRSRLPREEQYPSVSQVRKARRKLPADFRSPSLDGFAFQGKQPKSGAQLDAEIAEALAESPYESTSVHSPGRKPF